MQDCSFNEADFRVTKVLHNFNWLWAVPNYPVLLNIYVV